MDERQALTQEMMLKAIMSSSNDSVDMLQLMASVLEDIERGVKQANAGIVAVKEDTEKINTKIDLVLERLDGLEAAFEELKNEIKAEVKEEIKKDVLDEDTNTKKRSKLARIISAIFRMLGIIIILIAVYIVVRVVCFKRTDIAGMRFYMIMLKIWNN